jgi:hypothetical protein
MNIYWVFFLVIIVMMFIGGETYALAYGRQTLSRFTWNLSKTWPPLPWVVGILTGFIASHFWWGGSLICY